MEEEEEAPLSIRKAVDGIYKYVEDREDQRCDVMGIKRDERVNVWKS